MKDVNMYIYTEYTGSLKAGTGKYHVILETTIEDINGKTITWTNLDGKKPVPIMGTCEETTKNRLELYALDQALGHMTKPSRIFIYTTSDYIIGTFKNRWIDKWIQNDFKTGNKLIKHADLWRSIAEKIDKHDYTFAKSEKTPYTRTQAMELNNLKKKEDIEK